MTSKLARTALLVSTLAAVGSASGQDVGQHPAVFTPRQLPGIDASTFIVAHPASPRFVRGHANYPHPAVSAYAAPPHIDANTYLVQPPAATRWLPARFQGATPTLAQVPVVLR